MADKSCPEPLKYKFLLLQPSSVWYPVRTQWDKSRGWMHVLHTSIMLALPGFFFFPTWKTRPPLGGRCLGMPGYAFRREAPENFWVPFEGSRFFCGEGPPGGGWGTHGTPHRGLKKPGCGVGHHRAWCTAWCRAQTSYTTVAPPPVALSKRKLSLASPSILAWDEPGTILGWGVPPRITGMHGTRPTHQACCRIHMD